MPRRNWRSYLAHDIANNLVLEIELIAVAIATGIKDAATYTDYRTFVSNQTGNTAFLAVGALGIGAPINLPYVALSLGCFLVGGLSLGQLGDYFGRLNRGWLLSTMAFQTTLGFTAAALRKWYALSSRGHHSYPVIILLAFESGGQVALARTVNVAEITTAMVTSAYIDMVVDPNLFARHNRPRNRRIFLVAGLLVGSFIGAIAHRYVGPSFALFLSAICKMAVCIALIFNPPSSPKAHPEEKAKSTTGSRFPRQASDIDTQSSSRA